MLRKTWKMEHKLWCMKRDELSSGVSFYHLSALVSPPPGEHTQYTTDFIKKKKLKQSFSSYIFCLIFFDFHSSKNKIENMPAMSKAKRPRRRH